MNRITPPLKPQTRGPDVAHLHEALAFLGFAISDDEKANQVYGASTRQVVSKFQTEQQLPATGQVDEATANAINTVLAEKDALDPPLEDSLFSVQGEIVEPDGTPLPQHVVRAYDRALGGRGELVEA